MKCLALITSFFLLTSTSFATTLGVLENGGREVRPLFNFEKGKWQSFGENNKIIKNWNLAFDGKDYGAISTNNTKIELSQSAKNLIRKFDKKNSVFSYDGSPVFRPFVIVSEGFYKDPDQWKPLNLKSLDSKLKKQIFIEYLKTYNSDNCTANLKEITPQQIKKIRPNVKMGESNSEYYEVNFDYVESDIAITNSYASKSGYIFTLSMKNPFGNKCSLELTQVCSTFFIAKDKNNTVTNLTKEVTNGCRTLPVVDAGDYNKDGVSEIIFKDLDYNWNGYLLFDPKTQLIVRSGQSYH